MRKWVAAISVAAIALAFMVPVRGQTLSDQVLLLLARANSWTARQTFTDVTVTGTCTGCVGSGAGTVTSVAMTISDAISTLFSLSGSPITGSGTFSLSMDTQTPNNVLIGPSTGSAAVPTFRPLVDADIPNGITISGTNIVSWAALDKSASDLADLATRSAASLSSGALALARLTDSGTANLPLVSGGSGGDPVYEALDLTSSSIVTGQLVAASFPALTGHITTAGGALATTLVNSGVTLGTYGASGTIPILTVDATGRVTVASEATVSSVALLDASRHSDTASDSATRGSLIFGNTANAWDELAIGATGEVLRSDGTDVAWDNDGTGLKINVSNVDGGTLSLEYGGIGASLSASQGSVIYGTSTALAFTAVGSSGECLESRGTDPPAWDTCAAGGTTHPLLSPTHTDTTEAAVSRGSIIIGSGGETPKWIELPIGSTGGSFLRSDGLDASWGINGSALTQLNAANIASGTLSTARLPTLPVNTGGTGLTAFAIGDLLTANTATSLTAITAPVAGQVLASAGAGVVPAYSSTLLTTAAGVGVGGEAVSSTTFLAIEASTASKSHLRLTEGANKTGSLVEGDIWYDGSNFKGYNASGSVTLDVQSTSGGGFTDDGAVVRLTTASDTLGVGTTSTSAKVDIVSTSAQLELAYDGSNNLTFTVASDGETVIGGAGSGNRVVMNNVPLAFEGATANAFETTFAFTDPTADRTITFPDGNVTIGSSAVTISGTPANNQLAVWTSSTALEGESDITWDGSIFSALGNLVVGTTGGASHTMTFTTSHATDPVLTASGGVLNLSAGAMQVAGSAVADAGDTLAHFAATTSDQLRGVISNETGSGGGLVFATGPTLSAPVLGAATGTSLVVTADVKAAADFYLETNNKFYYGENTGGAARQVIGMDSSNNVAIAGNADPVVIGANVTITNSNPTLSNSSGDMIFSSEDSLTIMMDNNSTNDTSELMIFKTDASSTVMTINESNQVGIGASHTTDLQVGSFSFTGGDVPSAGAITVTINSATTPSHVDNGYQLTLTDSGALASDSGGGVGFQAVYDGSNNITTLAGIKGLRENATSGNHAGYLQFLTRGASGSNTERLRISSTGVMKVASLGTGANYYVCADADGTLHEETTCSGSSLRFKEGVQDLQLGLDTVQALRPVTFDWREEYRADQERQLGFVAEEVQQVSELLVTYRDNEIHGVKYAEMTALLVSAVQELTERIEALERAYEQ